jgi:hypothetical protein
MAEPCDADEDVFPSNFSYSEAALAEAGEADEIEVGVVAKCQIANMTNPVNALARNDRAPLMLSSKT